MSNHHYPVLRNAWMPSPLSVPAIHICGAISFANAAPSMPSLEIPHLHIALPQLQGDPLPEWWAGGGPMNSGQQGNLRYRHDADWLFGVIEIAEAWQATDTSRLQHATETAYRQIFALLDRLAYPHLYRFWNYMPGINQVEHGLERYRQFNRGRQDAFLACGRAVAGELPAACALGTQQGLLQIAFLAGRTPARAVENPRQTNAYAYPEDYGPRSPTFSRATLLQMEEADLLFISGTASIVGHRTLHAGDAAAQARETLANLEALMTEANRLLPARKFDAAEPHYRVYVRHAGDVPAIAAEMRRLTGGEPSAVYLQADICRADLLLEIEATVRSRILTSPDRQ